MIKRCGFRVARPSSVIGGKADWRAWLILAATIAGSTLAIALVVG